MTRYWCFVDRGDGFEKRRQRNPKTGAWSYSCTVWQMRKARKYAKRKGYGFRAMAVPKVKSKPAPDVAVRYPNATHVTPHFTWKEVACKDGTPVPEKLRKNMVRLCWALEKARELYGGPLPLLSVYRTEAHNRAIGGASQSQHVKATAADFNVALLNRDKLLDCLERVDAFYNGGIGVYPNGGAHADVRGYKARWSSY